MNNKNKRYNSYKFIKNEEVKNFKGFPYGEMQNLSKLIKFTKLYMSNFYVKFNSSRFF
jgi:hypothetical protein